MIKVKNIKTGEVFDVIKVSGEYWIDDTGYIESEQLGITWELIDDYKQLYEQQKQYVDELEDRLTTELEENYQLENKWYSEIERADELEKRWSKLVDVLKRKYEYYKVRADDESAGPVEQGKWKIAKLELMMVLMAIAELQEDDNA